MTKSAFALRVALALITFWAGSMASSPTPNGLGIVAARAVQPSALPPIPPAPTTTLPTYPDCRNDHNSIAGNVRKANLVRSCLLRLNAYERTILQGFASRMNQHSALLQALWNSVNSGPYDYPQKLSFYALISPEFAKSRPGGEYMNEYNQLYSQYLADSSFLRTEYCNLVRCPGAPQ